MKINTIVKMVAEEFQRQNGVKKIKIFKNPNGAQSVMAYDKNSAAKYLFIRKNDGTRITKSYYTKFILLPEKKIERNISIVIEKKTGIIKKIVTENYFGTYFKKILNRLFALTDSNKDYIDFITKNQYTTPSVASFEGKISSVFHQN
jgi:hypothetical protein